MGSHGFTHNSREFTSKIAKVPKVSGSHVRKPVRHRVSAVTSSVAPSLLPIPGSPVLTSCPPQGRGETGDWGRGHVTIDILPDDVLLEIFDNCTDENSSGWHTLVHVCQQWRSVVFASTHRLNLRLWCSYKTPARKTLDIWPALPIIIQHEGNGSSQEDGADNIVAALGHPDRVYHIGLWNTPNSDLNQLAAAMNEPFPELRILDLRTISRNTVLVLPDLFLGGSAPRLHTLYFSGISFLAMPKLLSSASHLVTLGLFDIPHSGYISPEAMAIGLSALTGLQDLSIGFLSPRSRPGQPSSSRSIRTVLPALNQFMFRGVSEYLEDLTSRIDAPLLSDLYITLFNQLIFNTPRLCLFISRAEKLRLQTQVRMTFYRASVELSLMTNGRRALNLRVLCKASDWQLSSLAQVCDSPFLSLFNLEHLEICEHWYSTPHWQEDVENVQWLELLHPFTAVKRLSLSKEFAPRVVPALQEFSGEGVLPVLQSIFLSETSLLGSVKEAFAQFLTARQLSGHPVTVNS